MSLLYAAPRSSKASRSRASEDVGSQTAQSTSAQPSSSPDQASSSMFIFPSRIITTPTDLGTLSDEGSSVLSDADYSALSTADLSPLSTSERSPYLESISGFSDLSPSTSARSQGEGYGDHTETLQHVYAIRRTPLPAYPPQPGCSPTARPGMQRGSWQWEELRQRQGNVVYSLPSRPKLSPALQRQVPVEPRRPRNWLLSLFASFFSIDPDTLALVRDDSSSRELLFPGPPLTIREDAGDDRSSGDARIAYLLCDAGEEGRIFRKAITSAD
ncbi:uncharacterized protein SCHCODRAFT_02615615 [Schizophyllum commune H4-8]|nr:uncharacterized protein SCHCODRAFT_02615615 [Schizophyllum commune H4-8]KAI5896709.1 hypothetical protein SCHCODRAFT_02615615 [Schizophyllum commune H4-8]